MANSSMGGIISEATLADLTSTKRDYQMNWVDKLRSSIDFISPDNTLICIADAPFYEQTQSFRPIALSQSVSWGENLAATLAPEIGTRRKRAMIGSSQGGSLQISQMILMSESPLHQIVKANTSSATTNSNNTWVESEWLALVGLNHDALRTPSGLVIVEGSHSGDSYSAYMFEQCVAVGQNRGYQAGQAIVVDNLSLIFEQVRPIFSISAEGGLFDGTSV